MIIKSHIRGGYRSAAEYLKEQGQNEKTRLVEISDPSAKNLDDAFHNMWVVASNTKCTKLLHHISINPMKDERLTDAQVMAILGRCEEKYGYKMFHHQRVIVEHIKDGRQHFHVIWNRVSLMTCRPVWPGEHWKKSKQICREMEKELGLKTPIPKRFKGTRKAFNAKSRSYKKGKVYKTANHRRKHQGYAKTKSYKAKPHEKAYVKANNSRVLNGSFSKNRFSAPIKPRFARTVRLKSTNKSWNTQGRYDGLNPARPIAFASLIPPTIKPILFKSFKETPQQPIPQRPVRGSSGWPEAAVLDWKSWGHRNPPRFFDKWPELAP